MNKTKQGQAGSRVRKMPFLFPDDIKPHWNAHRPEWSQMVNGASLAMPYLEPYLIRTMRKVLPDIVDEKLRNELRWYIGQEAQHYQQHRKFNDVLIDNYYPELKCVEAQMKEEFDGFANGRSQKFNLAYACGFETMALSMGHWLVKDREYLFAGSDTRVASLVLWHFVEEIEHKSVAFDVYQQLHGGYFYRVFATLFATMHVMKFSRKAYKIMLKKDGLWKKFHARRRLALMICRLFAKLVPRTLIACLPGHHPSNMADPKWSLSWIALFERSNAPLAALDTDNLDTNFSH